MSEPFIVSGLSGATIARDWSAFSITFQGADGAEQEIKMPMQHLSAFSGLVQGVWEAHERRQPGDKSAQKGNWREVWTRKPRNVNVNPHPIQGAVGVVFDLNTPFQMAYVLQPNLAKEIGLLLLRVSEECVQDGSSGSTKPQGNRA
jgi:hypothetical protein